jgi:hypothetical protein
MLQAKAFILAKIYSVNENKNVGKQEKPALTYFGDYYYNYCIDLRLISK